MIKTIMIIPRAEPELAWAELGVVELGTVDISVATL